MIIPAELVEAIFEASLRAMREWHEENDFPVEGIVCSAAMSIVEKMVQDLMSEHDEPGTMQ